MKRREILGYGVAATAVTAAVSAATSPDHAHMDHGPRSYAALAASAAECEARGELCLQHCVEMLTNGDDTMGGCAQSVRQMLAACRAIHALAVQRSSYVPRLAPIVRDICRACELECEKFAATHDVCRDCRDACVRCARECAAVAG